MTIVVGTFDNPQDLDEAIVKLADEGFEDTVFDESIDSMLLRNPGDGNPG